MNRKAKTRYALFFFTALSGLLAFTAPALSSLGQPAPELLDKTWLNSEPLKLANLKGKVVMVEFWTFECSNCRHVQPYVKQWNDKYRDKGLVTIGVHAPEFAAEADVDNVRKYLRDNDITYPVAIDNDFATWNNYDNHYWPARYLIDKNGVLRHVHIGEGDYAENEREIQNLLAE